MTRRWVNAALLSASLLLFGCRDARTSDVTGFWRLQNFSRQYLPGGFEQLTPTLHVITDQTFVATDIPVDTVAGVSTSAQPRTFRGTWVLQRDGKGVDMLVLQGGGAGSATLPIVVDHGAKGHHLHYFLSDPNAGEAIQFERIQ